jgi:hypothetical protein
MVPRVYHHSCDYYRYADCSSGQGVDAPEKKQKYNMIEYLKWSALALLLTIVVEGIVAWLFGLRSRRELLTITLINVITNPLLNYLITVNSSLRLISQTNILIWCLEVIIVFAEWRPLVWVLKQNSQKMLLLSFVMNACSYGAGLLIFR